MTPQITYDGKLLSFKVIKSGRRKTSEITIEPDGVVIRVPSGKSVGDIDKIVRKKAVWIIRKQQEYDRMTLEVSKPTFEEGSRLPYLGNMIRLEILKVDGPAKIRLLRGKFLVTTSHVDKETIRQLYENWLWEKAEKTLPVVVETYSKILGIPAPRIVIKNMQKRWGSATKDNVLNLNVNLLKSPENVIDYIVLHELCHLKERNHSYRFWSLVDRIMPDYEKRAEWLRANALELVE